jgi:mono/diheme cytochrome c family protein
MKLGLAIAIAALTVSPAYAADLTTGQQLARQWCANCHVIGSASPGLAAPQTAQQGPPSLQAVAQSDMPSAQLRAFLSHPHGQMPDLSLSRAEIDDLVAYIQSIR